VDAKSQSRAIERATLERQLTRARELVGHLRADEAAGHSEIAGSGEPSEQLRNMQHAVLLLERRLADFRPH
jgi:hypothetical protein